MPLSNELENNFLIEIRGMREDFRRVSQELGELTGEVKHLAHSQEQTLGYGERIRSLETEVANIKTTQATETGNRESADRSAATERRWVIGILVSTVLAIVFFIVQNFKLHP